MKKSCVICGAAFFAAPSSKKVTCSPECRSKRAALSARKGHKWSQSAKLSRSNDPKIKDMMAALQAEGTAAALMIPEGQKGPQNRSSKVWVLIDPDGNQIEVTNLLDWARNNYSKFEPDCTNPEKAAERITKGFGAIASSMRGVSSRTRPVYHYKDWGLDGIPTERNSND